MKKIVLLFFSLFVLHFLSLAENNLFCKAAQDSMQEQFLRKEFGCYIPAKNIHHLYYFVTIGNDFYKKVPVRVTKSDNDSIKATKRIVKNFQAVSFSQPLDTNDDFKRCYNLAFQPKLDSMFKCDFFRNVDSIMLVYDNSNRGYSSVEFPGGSINLQKYMDKNVLLPKDIKPNDNGNVVRVFYSFYVDEKGKVSEPTLLKSNCKNAEPIVLDVIKNLPAFSPARNAGKPMKVKYIFPYIKNLSKIKN